ncbi:MAG TPA: hypothetical protein VIO37_09120 [Candidatus Dormibacteraeota bacterium]
MTNLQCNSIGSPVHIGGSEAKQAKAGTDEAVLAAIVINQPITVVAAVVFDCQALNRIKQVWAAWETVLIVMDGNLNLRSRESGQHEDHPQPGLHWGFGLRLGQVDNTSEPRDALGSSMLGNMGTQIGDGNEPGMKEHVRADDPFGEWISASEVDHRTDR